MKYLVLFGPPGSGKGTQSENIIKKYGYAHISTGDVLRAETANQTPLGVEAKKFMDAGQLVPDSLIIDMLAKTMDSYTDAKGIIFDGFPRTVAQAQALKEMLGKKVGFQMGVRPVGSVDEKQMVIHDVADVCVSLAGTAQYTEAH